MSSAGHCRSRRKQPMASAAMGRPDSFRGIVRLDRRPVRGAVGLLRPRLLGKLLGQSRVGDVSPRSSMPQYQVVASLTIAAAGREGLRLWPTEAW